MRLIHEKDLDTGETVRAGPGAGALVIAPGGYAMLVRGRPLSAQSTLSALPALSSLSSSDPGGGGMSLAEAVGALLKSGQRAEAASLLDFEASVLVEETSDAGGASRDREGRDSQQQHEPGPEPEPEQAAEALPSVRVEASTQPWLLGSPAGAAALAFGPNNVEVEVNRSTGALFLRQRVPAPPLAATTATGMTATTSSATTAAAATTATTAADPPPAARPSRSSRRSNYNVERLWEIDTCGGLFAAEGGGGWGGGGRGDAT